MRRISDLQEGDLIKLENAAILFDGVDERTLYRWREGYKKDPDRYPPSFTIGRKVFFLKRPLIDFINRRLTDAA